MLAYKSKQQFFWYWNYKLLCILFTFLAPSDKWLQNKREKAETFWNIEIVVFKYSKQTIMSVIAVDGWTYW